MIHDQASALRQLKKLRDSLSPDALPTAADLLASLPRPSGFPAIALVVPEHQGIDLPPLTSWIHSLLGDARRACLWDQAGLISLIAPTGVQEPFTPAQATVESAVGPLLALPRIPGLAHLPGRPEADRIRFVRHLLRCLGSCTELWITLRAGELAHSQAILHATDLACLLVPQHPDAILRSYEAVKTIHLSGYFSTFGLIGLDAGEADGPASLVDRIMAVAKQFLSLDLVPAGMVLSGQSSRNSINTQARGLIARLDPSSCEFFWFLTERLLNPIPGDVPLP
ncbi:MAG: hypothetical protein OZSIB_4347 [Candidatus Ozemobacter sibiricus]|jgi:hypothetical protein|uniref:Uncharacterized protein n=1 Tax=Candidatus Ozemobacter sibiricus TaxID=2268124 RepID=A0A367ZAV1_9BACT|nr:MAG: hypothetical protein OZSIB_4347 [Candidatus Ozemobacter sibiricus]